jgi:transcriptional regulator with XRE-family HTH domain
MSDSHPRHFLRAWREYRSLTLEQVAERVELLGAERPIRDPGGLTYPKHITHASLSRIERGIQPYNQALLELLAEIYMTEPASLIIRNPTDPEGIWSLWEQLKPGQREAALAMLQGLVQRTGTNG